MPRIVISYRRLDSNAITGRIFDRLVAQYGRGSVFRDIDNIPIGVDFRQHINQVLAESDILLVVVGPRWLGGRAGQNRIDNPVDPVRIEVETALCNRIPVVPILVGRAGMPKVDQLPDSLEDFAYRNGLNVDAGQDFDVHVNRLIRAMDVIFANARLTPSEEQTEPEIVKTSPTTLPTASGTNEAFREAEDARKAEEARRQPDKGAPDEDPQDLEAELARISASVRRRAEEIGEEAVLRGRDVFFTGAKDPERLQLLMRFYLNRPALAGKRY
jgi:hypothetical protein